MGGYGRYLSATIRVISTRPAGVVLEPMCCLLDCQSEARVCDSIYASMSHRDFDMADVACGDTHSAFVNCKSCRGKEHHVSCSSLEKCCGLRCRERDSALPNVAPRASQHSLPAWPFLCLLASCSRL